MKKLFIETKYIEKFNLDEKAISKLPDKLLLATTIQYFDSLEDIKRLLESKGKKVLLFQGKHTKYPGQILGCSIEKIDTASAFLYIGDGMFHPIVFLIQNPDNEVFIYNPWSKELKHLDKEYVKSYELKVKENLNKFSQAQNIGIIVTTKPGQERLGDAIVLKQKLTEKGKRAFIFICNTLDFLQLLNFPFIECWVNTMCPRIAFDDAVNIERPIVNIDEIWNY